jgi:hypothetical protein
LDADYPFYLVSFARCLTKMLRKQVFSRHILKILDKEKHVSKADFFKTVDSIERWKIQNFES